MTILDHLTAADLSNRYASKLPAVIERPARATVEAIQKTMARALAFPLRFAGPREHWQREFVLRSMLGGMVGAV